MKPISLAELGRRLNKLDVNKITRDAVVETKEDLERLNREQLKAGSSAEGGNLRRYRNVGYAKMKNQMNALPGFGNPDLLLTGSFHSGIEAKAGPNSFSLESKDSKSSYLERRYGRDLIYGLNGRNMNIYRGFLQPEVIKSVRSELRIATK